MWKVWVVRWVVKEGHWERRYCRDTERPWGVWGRTLSRGSVSAFESHGRVWDVESPLVREKEGQQERRLADREGEATEKAPI
jgi:hypothetical protein